MKHKAEMYLKKALRDADAGFRNGQWESIEKLLQQKRVLVVQSTGWGKSMVYFLTTKLLRMYGSGPTLLISPLLSLMRNQLEAAERLGIKARTINSSNVDDWDEIKSELTDDEVDVLLISPERLANDDFRGEVLASIAGNIGLFVIDEAHCISDWGHDFRPDYRRIVRVIEAIPSNVPILATTATANNRVVEDIQAQLGSGLEIMRGSLVRHSLRLQNINMPSQSDRLAWLAINIPKMNGSGIVYTLTQPDAERVAEWLKVSGIIAAVYHAGLKTEDKEKLEQRLLNNDIKALVATVALGMGFDKPDIGFVVHYQRPSSVVHYYQQVGRAGRSIDSAYGVLLCGVEDDAIADYFIKSAFPPQINIVAILRALLNSEMGLSIPELQKELNLRQSSIEKTLKFLTVESPSPVYKDGTKWKATASASTYSVSQEYVDNITGIRKKEQQQMQKYMTSSGCLMGFLQRALDDPHVTNCGKCFNCDNRSFKFDTPAEGLIERAVIFLKKSYQLIQPRKQWPAQNMFNNYPLSGKNINAGLQAFEGRALCLWRDAGWGQLVYRGKYKDKKFADELVTACVRMMREWNPDPMPKWVTCVPSLNHPELVPDFALRLAGALGIPFVLCVEKVIKNAQQKTMENSYKQASNLDGVFKITKDCRSEECLLIDDMVDSRWTFTVVSALLRNAGCDGVYPLALALNSPRVD
ncbi:RecQ family ATP-dependent DNA helicase [Sphaerochaeta sp.]|uniref:RecQ family ATP-dependent DNA helicase n=1 Tax=Sphaerochaeta sp. TaxID=1972642 RepID=UPI003D11F228